MKANEFTYLGTATRSPYKVTFDGDQQGKIALLHVTLGQYTRRARPMEQRNQRYSGGINNLPA